MNKYELVVILVPSLNEENKELALSSVKETISRFGAVVGEVDDWGRRKLAYRIRMEPEVYHNEGYYYLVNFESENDVPAQIESRLRIHESVLRYLIVRKED